MVRVWVVLSNICSLSMFMGCSNARSSNHHSNNNGRIAVRLTLLGTNDLRVVSVYGTVIGLKSNVLQQLPNVTYRFKPK